MSDELNYRDQNEENTEGTSHTDNGPSSVEYGPSFYQSYYARGGEAAEKKSNRRIVALVVALTVIIAALSGVGGVLLGSYLNTQDSSSLDNGASNDAGGSASSGHKQDNVVIYETAENAVSADGSVASVAAKSVSSVVEIMTEAASNRYPNQTISGAGSGVVFAQSKTENYTYIITNNHVVEGYDTIIVRSTDGKEYNATVVGTDWMTDIAVLRIVVRGLNIATCASSDDLVLGQEVVAIGNPLGQLGGSVSPGYVSGLSRTISIEGIPMTLLQTDAAINPGNSGGGLFDMNGNLIGIVNAKSVGEELDNIGFAIPINTAKTAAAEIIEKGYVSGRADLGFAFGTGITTSGLSIYSYAYNTEVNTEIKQGYLLYSFIIDGKEVNVSSIETYRSILTTLKVGDTVQARIYTPSSTWGGTVYRDSFVVTLKVHEYIPS